MRAPNEIDFWRGLALIMIYIDHIPGNAFENYTYQHIGISDAADVFVFLAGWSLHLVTRNAGIKYSLLNAALRLENRALTLYLAQIVITALALGISAAGAAYYQDGRILEWNNAAIVFENPLESQIGILTLAHQLAYFDILPLYIVLMAMAPVVMLAGRWNKWGLLAGSLALYASVLWFGLNLPTWPVDGRWYFNPFAWQLTFVIGYLVADPKGITGFVRRRRHLWRWLALPLVLAGAAAALWRWFPDPFLLPQPRLFFMFNKTFASPARIVHLLAAAALVGGVFSLFLRWMKPLAIYCSMLGRNSLNVFCVGSLLALVGQLIRYVWGGFFLVDCVVLILGLSVFGAVAWLSEWNERIK